MKQAINAYQRIAVSPEFKELEKMRSIARHNEAAALRHARNEERKLADTEWQSVVADKDAKLADKDAKLADQAAEIARLREQLDKK